MDYSSMNQYSKTYKIGNTYYAAHADFLQNRLEVKFDNVSQVFNLEDYTDFEGNMEDFIKAELVGDD